MDYFVQAANHKDQSQSFSIFDVSTAKIHTRSDRWLRTFSEGTQRTYAYHLVDHLRWLKAVNASEESVGVDELRRYMALCGAEQAGPLGTPWLDAPLSASALQVRAAVLKGYYLDVTSREAINEELKTQLTATRLPTRALKDRQFLAHVSARDAPVNPLAPQSPPRRHPRLMPDGVTAALMDCVNTARDRMIVTWLNDSGVRVGELCGLQHADLHLRANHECGEERLAHFHVIKRSNPNRARAKRGRPARLEDGVVRGGSVRYASPAMIETYLEYLTDEYFQVRGLATSNLVLVQLQNQIGTPLSTHGVRQMLARAGRRAGAGKVRPHSFRHTWATALTEASGIPALTAKAGGWSSAKTVEETYLHLAASDLVSKSLERVWSRNDL
ncbi:recombinase XerC [Mycolicibacter arupensis]|uniref:Recombinase XerC n=1 Tax=Mycolicibacter arupensis TaxID=342002 RepID=A0A0F5N277_9MYCO|nr:recombinase XerC [Mycolicibacter arupensis]